MVAEQMEDLWAKLMPLTYAAYNQQGAGRRERARELPAGSRPPAYGIHPVAEGLIIYLTADGPGGCSAT